MIAYQRFSPTPLTPEECDMYVAQSAISAQLLGVVDPPLTVAQLYERLAAYGPELEFSAATADVIDLLINNPPLELPMRWGYDMLKVGAISLLPDSTRTLLGLEDSNEPSRVSLEDFLWRRPVARVAITALRWTVGQTKLSAEVERAAEQ